MTMLELCSIQDPGYAPPTKPSKPLPMYSEIEKQTGWPCVWAMLESEFETEMKEVRELFNLYLAFSQKRETSTVTKNLYRLSVPAQNVKWFLNQGSVDNQQKPYKQRGMVFLTEAEFRAAAGAKPAQCLLRRPIKSEWITCVEPMQVDFPVGIVEEGVKISPHWQERSKVLGRCKHE